MRRATCLALLALVPAPAAADAPTDLAGDPLPPGAVVRLGTVRYRVRTYSRLAFITPDGKTLVGQGGRDVVRFWEADTGKPAGEIADPDLYDWTAALSPDGRRLAVFGLDRRGNPAPDTTLRVFDLATRKPVWTAVIEEPDRGTRAVRFTPDGKHLVTAAQDVRVWDAGTGNAVRRLDARAGYSGIDVSADGTTVGFVGAGVTVWDWSRDGKPRTIEVAGHPPDWVRFAPDGKTVYAGGADGVRAFDLATGKAAGRLESGGPARWLAFSPDGKTYATGWYNIGQREGWVVLRATATGKEVARLPSGADLVDAGSWSADGSRFAAPAAHRLWVWDLKTGKALGADVAGHNGIVTGLAFAPDGRLFTASDDHTVRAWDPATGKELLRLEMDGWVRGLAVSGDGSLAAGSGLRNELVVWEAKAGRRVFKLLGHGDRGGLRRARFAADDQTLVSFGDDGYLRVWDTLTGKLKTETRLGTLGDEVGENRLRAQFDFRAVDLGPDGNTLAIASGKDVQLISADTGKERLRFEADPRRVTALTFSPDGRRLAVLGPGPPGPKAPGGPPPGSQLTVWDMVEARPVVRVGVGPTEGSVLALGPGGKTVVTDTPAPGLKVWDAATGALVGTLDLPDRPVCAAIDGAGKRVAVALWDTTVLVYDLAAARRPGKAD